MPRLGAKKCGKHEYPTRREGALSHSLFLGVSHADLQWLFPSQLEGLARFDDYPISRRAIRSGHIVFSSITPWAFDENEIAHRHHRRRAFALVTRLLCNLGTVPYDGFVARLTPDPKNSEALPAPLYADESRADDDPYRYYRW
jgi:hypothetical protein